ncbi:uncharacterized protein LOC128244204 [Mya arenaria]|uniref:uncharacterized protein LOC128244204 n=1 Tax=Mya arenaria TaxID=6604 RepID=UPI0022E30E24|nr:uncharacterized protein LOC128244204 [Mya arenaria]
MSTENTEAGEGELQELALLMENRTFVDYFNTFLCLPVFGQHVFYNFLEAEFDFEPPIRNRRHLYLDRREILRWLWSDRYIPFRRSTLYVEYQLCLQLRATRVTLPGIKPTEDDGEDCRTLVWNVMGTVTGMLHFRESLRNTCGEAVYRCWRDIETWKRLEDPVKRMYLKHTIKTKYISQGRGDEVKNAIMVLVFRGVLNFGLVPGDIAGSDNVHEELGPRVVEASETDAALLELQGLLIAALKKYWLPRHLVRVVHTSTKETLDLLKRTAPGDTDTLSNERRLRCRFMFPTIYQASGISSPATEVYESMSATDLPGQTPTDVSESSEELDEVKVEHIDLLSLWGGPARDIFTRKSLSSCSLPGNDSPDELSRRSIQSKYLSAARHIRSPIPIELTSFLCGKKRTQLGNFPNISNRVLWSLASDMLACCPFRSFLEKNDHLFDLRYLNFWTDVRIYMDTDDNAVDDIGRPLRRALAHRIVSRYLYRNQGVRDLFPEALKKSIFYALNEHRGDNVLCMAQDIAQESMWEPLRHYMQDERRRFLNQVRGKRYQLSVRKLRHMDKVVKKTHGSYEADDADPLFFFQCNTVDTASAASANSPTPSTTPLSRPGTSYNMSISQEQMWKAMELTVLCSEYGVSMMVPQKVLGVEQLPDVLYSDYGSLHISRVATVRNDKLRKLTEKPKIDIETIKVSRRVLCIEEVDYSSFKRKNTTDKPEVEVKPRGRIVSRRIGAAAERPPKPKSFIEILTTTVHYDFFKRFMAIHKMSTPLMFWRAVEDLKDLSNSSTRQIRVSQIIRKFFGKYSKYGTTLDCDEEIIEQIPNMDKVTPGILICAQAAVFRSMERKWYPMYMETYPAESGNSSPDRIRLSPLRPTANNVTPDFANLVKETATRQKRKRGIFKTRKTLATWRSLTSSLVDFNRGVSSKQMSQLFEIFLKCEVEREQTNINPDQHLLNSQLQNIEKNAMPSGYVTNVQTRVVIRHRLVILNRLPSDLRFWTEVKKFQDLTDTMMSRGSVSAQDTEFLCDKIRSIISCYLASEVSPRVQINVPSDLALNIINSLASSGPTRGIFHDAIILLFPVLYHYYGRFTEEWMKGEIPEEYMDIIEQALRGRVTDDPHANEKIPDYTDVKADSIKVTTQLFLDEGSTKIQFSLANGITLVYPMTRIPRTPPNVGRRMTRHSILTLNEVDSPKKDSKQRIDKRGGDEKKRSEKIIVKEGRNITPATKKTPASVDHMRRLNLLLESLNREREEKMKEQNRRFSKMINFESIVAAAMAERSETNSMQS